MARRVAGRDQWIVGITRGLEYKNVRYLYIVMIDDAMIIPDTKTHGGLSDPFTKINSESDRSVRKRTSARVTPSKSCGALQWRLSVPG